MKSILSVCLLVFSAHAQIHLSTVESITVCERDTMQISCDGSKEIHITEASYGRLEGAKTCPHSSVRMESYQCHAESSERVLIEACEGKSTCVVDAKNGVFGDPCRGLFKYLRVAYMCIDPSQNIMTVCEHQRMNIDCGDGKTIKIESARYGRRDTRETCPHPTVTSATYDCRADSSEQVLIEACEGRSRCHVDARNSVFGDPCPGLFKYLRVAYQCVESLPKSKTVCENQRLDIYCDEPKKIRIDSASYGRSDNGEICPHPSIKTNRCHAESSERVVSEACEGNSQCRLVASNTVFGDPCGGTFKYLQVKYRCF